MRRNRKIKEAIDIGTPELARKFTIVPTLSDPTTFTGKVIDGTEVDRLLMRDVITAFEHGTLNSLAKKMHSYGFVGLKSPDYASPPVHLDPEMVSDKRAATIRGAVNLIKKMDQHPSIGKGRRIKLLHLVMEDAPWGKLRHQIEDLHHCIRALDDIFMRRV